jgi:hypothetical protein
MSGGEIPGAGIGALIERSSLGSPGARRLRARVTPQEAGPAVALAGGLASARQALALAIRMRTACRDLDRALEEAADHARELTDCLRIRTGAADRDYLAGALRGALGRAIALAGDLDSDSAQAIASELAGIRARVRRLSSGLGRDRDPYSSRGQTGATATVRDVIISRDIALSVEDARDSARGIAGELGAQQVDVSGADLSTMTIEDTACLEGVVWTSQTAWPPGIAGEVCALSREIRPGVYQVDPGPARTS